MGDKQSKSSQALEADQLAEIQQLQAQKNAANAKIQKEKLSLLQRTSTGSALVQNPGSNNMSGTQ